MKNKPTSWLKFGLSTRLFRLNLVMVVLLIAISALTSGVFWLKAAVVSSAQDLLSNETINETSDHQFSFALSVANTFTAGEEIAIDFTNDFSLGGVWDTSDFSFSDTFDRTVMAVSSGAGVSAVACADGAHNVGIAIDTTDSVFRVIPCGGSFIASGLGATVTFTISGTAPNGTLTNPVAAGSYVITFSDAGGDCSGGCTVAVPAVDRDWVLIQATAIHVCGNNILEIDEQCDDGNVLPGDGCSDACLIEGGVPPPADVTPPVITYHCATTIETDSATVTWETNEPANSTLQCGLTEEYGLTVFDPAYVLAHSLTIEGLAEGTLYHCRVCSADSPGNTACSDDCTFMTLDDSPPIISDIQCQDMTTDSFRVSWTTNENSTSFVDHGLIVGPPYANIAGVADSVLIHSVTVDGLLPLTPYHYRVRSGDLSGNEAFSVDHVCSTVGEMDAPPVISDVRVTDIGCLAPISAVVRWETDELSDSTVDYGLLAGPPYDSSIFDPVEVLEHAVTLNNLLGGTTYHYRVQSEDVGGFGSSTEDAVFSTPTGASPVISDVSAEDILAGSADIVWNTDSSADSTVDYGLTDEYGSIRNEEGSVFAHRIVLPGLNACTTYHYRARSDDGCTPEAFSDDHTFTTALLPAPEIEDLEVTHIGENSARVSWSTPTPTDSTVDYGETDEYDETVSSDDLELEHLVVLGGLSPNTTYHFRVRSTDSCVQSAISEDDTFTTLADLEPPGCVMNLDAVPGVLRIDLDWDNPPDADLVGVRLVKRQGICPVDQDDGDIVYDGLDEAFGDLAVAAGINYCYGAFGYDEAGNFGCGGIDSATPLGPPDIIPPACPVDFSAVAGDGQVVLSWTNPGDLDFAGTRVVRRTDREPAGPNDGIVVYDGDGTGWTDVGLTNGTTYYYGAFSYDLSANYCAGRFVEGTPIAGLDLVPPLCAMDLTATAGDSQVLLNWTNPADPGWLGTRIVRRDDRDPIGPADGLAVYEGMVDNHLDLGLTNGTTYYYGAYTYDAARNYCLGPNASATPREGLPPPVLDCSDSDGGLAYFVRGTVTTRDGDFLDACINRDVLRENYCAEGGLATDDHNCGNGYRCSAGRCVPAGDMAPVSVCGNGLCERVDCRVDCSRMSYDLYIINPDGSERHQNSALVRSVELGSNRYRLSFEDDGLDMDFDDVVLEMDTSSCEAVRLTLVSRGSAWNHQVRLAVSYMGVPKIDRFVWQDALTPMGSTKLLNIGGDASICRGNENELNCPVDCPPEPEDPEVEEEETVPEEERIDLGDLRFYATSARIQLPPHEGLVDSFPQLSVTVSLPFTELWREAENVNLNMGGRSYVMVPVGEAYEAKVVVSSGLGQHNFSVIVDYGDDLVDTVRGIFNVIPFGRVVEQVGGEKVGVDDVRVMLLSDFVGGEYGLWPSEASGQPNPTTSSGDGVYSFVAPVGSYKMIAEKSGYRTKETRVFPVSNALVTRELVLIAIPEDTEDVIQNIINEVDFQTRAVAEEVKEFTDNPFVEERTENQVAPAAVAVATANVAVASATTATAAPYLLYLYTLLTHPSLLFGARKRRKWGVVYDSITKQPVDLAIVRLINSQTNRIVRSTVTDREGRYFFMTSAGSYRLSVAKAGYVFPSEYLKGVTNDVRHSKLYHGEAIEVGEGGSIAVNIPVDPVAKEKAPRRVFWEGVARRAQHGLSIITLIAMVAAVVVSPTPFVIGMLAVNVVMFLVFRRLAAGRKTKNWGLVFDQQTRRPLRNVIVRVFEARYNKLLETKVTDLRGRYAFLVGNNVYYVTYEKPGYQKKQVGPLDLTKFKEEKLAIADDIGLTPDRPLGFMAGLKIRIGIILGREGKETKRASITKPPLAKQIGQTGHLIVGSDHDLSAVEAQEADENILSSSASEEGATDKAKEDNVPWEVRMIRKMSGKGVDKPLKVDNQAKDKSENTEKEP